MVASVSMKLSPAMGKRKYRLDRLISLVPPAISTWDINHESNKRREINH